MARPGLYRSDVEKARRALLGRGVNPSIDLVRTELGNTGSRSTIHRLLKEIEADEPASLPTGKRVGLSDALTDFVQRLAEKLQQEANAVVSEAETRFKAEQAQAEAALAAQREESARFTAALRHTEVSLNEERTAHEVTRQALNELRATSAAQAARIDGLTTQLDERDQRITSLEQKHSQAREALEHFRTAAKEQREQELRRHDYALQAVQLELRQAADTLTAKNHELQQLHRDNGRLLEQKITQDRELIVLRNELIATTEKTTTMSAELIALRDAERQHAAMIQQRDQLTEQLAHVDASFRNEMEIRRNVEAERDRLLGRVQAMEDVVVKRLERRQLKSRETTADPTTSHEPKAPAGPNVSDR